MGREKAQYLPRFQFTDSFGMQTVDSQFHIKIKTPRILNELNCTSFQPK